MPSILFAGVAVCSGGAGAVTSQVQELTLHTGDTVGKLELGAPTESSFELHATLPLPPRVYPRADGLAPFVITDEAGRATPAQVDIVSRYPNHADGSDFVEISGTVDGPVGAVADERIRYLVVFSPHATAPLETYPEVEALLEQPASLLLRTRDCFGNSYSADLYEDVRAPGGNLVRTLKDGAEVRQIVTHRMLAPDVAVGGPHGTLPHMMGAHAYVSTIAHEPFIALDLRIHNAASGNDPQDPIDDPLGKLYFRSLELRLPHGWTLLNAVADPSFGIPYDEGDYRVWPIVASINNGTMHVMPAMSQFHRRLAIVKDGYQTRAQSHIHEAGLAFCRPGASPSGGELFSWWNPNTARYFPQRQRLPSLEFMGEENLRAADRGDLVARLGQLASGAPGIWPAESPGLGWAQPWGTPDGGMVSGEEIFLYDGVTAAAAASTDGYRLHQVRHRMYTDRQCNALFDKNGLPTSLAEWIVRSPNGSTVPIWWYNSAMLWASDPFGFAEAPTFQQNYVAARRLQPAYEGALLGFEPIDEAHLVRYLHDTMALVWLGNDAIAKDDLRMQAEGFHFAYHEYPQDEWNAIQPSGLLAAETYVAANPGWGFAYGRGQAWGLNAMCAAYSTQDPAWRASIRPWFDMVADVIRDGQSTCTGVIQATPLSNVFNAKYRCRQSIEAAITDNALVGMRASVYDGVDPARVQEVNSILTKSTYAMIGPMVWNDAWHGPQAMMAVGPFDASRPPFCTFIPPDGTYGIPDNYQIWCSFAYGYALTGDATFLDKASEASGGGHLLQNLMNSALDPTQSNVPNQIALLALMQSLNGAH